MKKAFWTFFTGFLVLFTACADDTEFYGGQNIGNGGVWVTLEDSSAVGKGINIGSSQVTNAEIRLNGPFQPVQIAVWRPGSAGQFYFQIELTGTYNLSMFQTDTSNHTYYTNVHYEFIVGYNYNVTITLGGYVMIELNTNSFYSPPSSSSSSPTNDPEPVYSSSSSSLSSVSGSSSGR